jgi:hypothetical protein
MAKKPMKIKKISAKGLDFESWDIYNPLCLLY